MQHLVQGVREAVAREGWYAALALALTLPDTCAAIEGHPQGRQRYIAWAERYARPHFSAIDGTPFLRSDELYRLRNAFLHAGTFEVDEHDPQQPDLATAMFEVLNQVRLFVPAVATSRQIGRTPASARTHYSTGVPDFCEAICRAVEDWLTATRDNAVVRAAVERMLRITFIDPDTGEWTPL
jgi:hypothetical protein